MNRYRDIYRLKSFGCDVIVFMPCRLDPTVAIMSIFLVGS